MKRVILSPIERSVFELTCNFLEGRLKEPSVLLWAANLSDRQVAERQALDTLMFRIKEFDEPYRSAWAAIFEFWTRPDEQSAHERHLLKLDVAGSDRTSEEIRVITDAVRPYLSVGDPERFAAFYKTAKRGGSVEIRDLLHIGVSSGKALSPSDISLSKIGDGGFNRSTQRLAPAYRLAFDSQGFS